MSRPTLADVAARAGVSLKTASRAVNGEYGVAAATAEKVHEAARSLGFRPNHIARSLASTRTSSAVALVISSVSDPFFAAVAGAVEAVLTPRDLQLVSASHGDDAERQRRLVRALVERRVDALVLVPAPGDASYLRSEIDHGLVVVSIDRPLVGASVDTVTIDNQAAAHAVVAEFLAAGHRRIAAVGNDGRLWTMRQRHEGYLRALTEAGVAVDRRLMELDCRDIREAEAAVAAMLRLPDPPTAIFAAQNLAGRGAIRAMLGVGRTVDLAVFDEVSDPDLLVIKPVVVVESDAVHLGAVAAQMTMERLDGLTDPPREVVLPARFWRPEPAEAGVPA
jgi:LacI family transcriptional regulator